MLEDYLAEAQKTLSIMIATILFKVKSWLMKTIQEYPTINTSGKDATEMLYEPSTSKMHAGFG